MSYKKLITLATLLPLLGAHHAYSQFTPGGNTILGQDQRAITTGVPFLAITPDARSGGMGDVGVAISPDANAIHWNAAKLAYLESDIGFSLSITPWLSSIVNDMSISYLTGYKKIDDGQVLAISLRYFDLGDIQLTNLNGDPQGQISPREFAFGATYALQLGENLSAGVTGRFIRSNLLVGTTSSGGAQGRPGLSASADISVFYTKDVVFGGNEGNWSFGANISNIGPKIAYFTDANADFLPTNLRLGTAFTNNLDPFNKITIALDFNKLLVPTPTTPGRTSNVGLVSGIFQSFSDAPDGFSEEINEITASLGLEYWYNNLFAVRTGYFRESQPKGNRKYFTAGLGLRYQVFGVDFAYMFPQEQNNPLQETLRISLHFNFDQADEPDPDR